MMVSLHHQEQLPNIQMNGASENALEPPVPFTGGDEAVRESQLGPSALQRLLGGRGLSIGRIRIPIPFGRFKEF